MDYTSSNAYATDAGTGNRMHQQSAAVPTAVSDVDLNQTIWSLMEIVKGAGLTGIQFDRAVPATYQRLFNALKLIFGDGPGAVSFFARTSAPTGYLKANGAAVSRSVYSALFASVGTTFGAGDGATTFNLPDLRGEFLRGFDDGRGIDSGRALGSAQAGTRFPSLYVFSGSSTSGTLVSHPISSNTGYPNDNKASNMDSETVISSSAYMSVALSPGGGTSSVAFTARPRNVAMLACIKF